MVDFIFLGFGVLSLLSFIYFSLVSVSENESFAAKRALITSLLLSAPFILAPQINFTYKLEIEIIILCLILFSTLILFLPINFSRITLTNNTPKTKIDERDIMFSRNELEKRTERFEKYYAANPDKFEKDQKFREKPGLLNKGSVYYNKLMASSADASFEVVNMLAPHINGDVANEKEVIEKEKITNYIKSWTKKLGAIDVGITELKDYHFYSAAGRKNNYGNEIKNTHKYAIAFTVEMDYDMVKGGPAFPIVMESAQQYLNSGQIAVQLATFIRSLGYSALAHIDGNYQVVCPLVAKDAGLGEIGRMGLLMTKKLGPRVRLGVVTTELPMELDSVSNNESVIDFCTKCKKCADCCPSSAIQKEDRSIIDGVNRWKIDSEACFTFWCTAGSDCGRCVAVCPYSHPDNLLHNFVRWGINRNSLFRSLALIMDDFFYGRKPEANRKPNWTNL